MPVKPQLTTRVSYGGKSWTAPGGGGGGFNNGINRVWDTIRYGALDARTMLLQIMGDIWVNTVQKTAWVTGVPASRSTLITEVRGDSIRLGWHNYPGDIKRAGQRFSDRLAYYEVARDYIVKHWKFGTSSKHRLGQIRAELEAKGLVQRFAGLRKSQVASYERKIGAGGPARVR